MSNFSGQMTKHLNEPRSSTAVRVHNNPNDVLDECTRTTSSIITTINEVFPNDGNLKQGSSHIHKNAFCTPRGENRQELSMEMKIDALPHEKSQRNLNCFILILPLDFSVLLFLSQFFGDLIFFIPI